MGAVAFVEVIAVAVNFFKPRKTEPTQAERDAIIIAGAVDSFEPGTVSAFVQGKFYLARLDDGGFLAMSRNCTHLSCSVPWVSKENKFICPCHSSEFDMRGDVINPPAPRALDLYPISIENNILSVDTSKLRKRSVFEPTQVVYVKKT